MALTMVISTGTSEYNDVGYFYNCSLRGTCFYICDRSHCGILFQLSFKRAEFSASNTARFFTPQIESYRSKNDMKCYFFNGLYSLINLQPRKPIAERDPFDQLLNEFQEELEAANAPLSSFFADSYFARFFAELKKATYSQLVTLMPRLTPGCELANDFLKKLPHIHQDLKDKLKSFLASVPTDILNDQKEVWKKRLAQVCRSEYKQAYGQIIYFKDVEIIHQKRDF